MTTLEMPTLFDQTSVLPPKKRMTHEQAFGQFCRRNPWFMNRLAEVCFEMQVRGQRPSTKAAWEVLRSEVAPNGEGYALNNSWTSAAADRLAELYPDLRIERRKRKS